MKVLLVVILNSVMYNAKNVFHLRIIVLYAKKGNKEITKFLANVNWVIMIIMVLKWIVKNVLLDA